MLNSIGWYGNFKFSRLLIDLQFLQFMVILESLDDSSVNNRYELLLQL